MTLTDQPEGDFGLSIRDENGKIDLSSLLIADEEADPFVYAQILSLLEMFDLTEDRMDALLDWLDANDERRSQGAEDSDYQALDNPYPCRNGPLRTLGELALIIGWEDVTELRLLEDGSRILDYLTVGPTGGNININTASRVVLQTLDPEIDESLAEEIIALREETPFEDIQSLLLVQGMTQAIFRESAITSRSRAIFSTWTARGASERRLPGFTCGFREPKTTLYPSAGGLIDVEQTDPRG